MQLEDGTLLFSPKDAESEVDRMRILSWNIRQGGGRRLTSIVGAIEQHAPDVVLINEFRERTGPALIEALGRNGLNSTVHNEPKGREYGILVASSTSVRQLPTAPPTRLVPRSLLEVALSDGTTIGALYGPMVTKEHGPFWASVVDHAAANRQRPYLLVGDFNTCEAGVDCVQKRLAGSDQFVSIRQLGYRDLWRESNQHRTEHTWFSFGRGGKQLNGFRIDHALATPSLASRLKRCWYSHDERERRLSDHSLLLAEFAA